MVCSLQVDVLCGFVPICLFLAISQSSYDLHHQEESSVFYEDLETRRRWPSNVNIQNSFSSCSGAVSSVTCDLKTGLEEAQEQNLRKGSKHLRCASPGLCHRVQGGNN